MDIAGQKWTRPRSQIGKIRSLAHVRTAVTCVLGVRQPTRARAASGRPRQPVGVRGHEPQPAVLDGHQHQVVSSASADDDRPILTAGRGERPAAFGVYASRAPGLGGRRSETRARNPPDLGVFRLSQGPRGLGLPARETVVVRHSCLVGRWILGRASGSRQPVEMSKSRELKTQQLQPVMKGSGPNLRHAPLADQ